MTTTDQTKQPVTVRPVRRLVIAGFLFLIPLIIFSMIADAVHDQQAIRGDSATLMFLNSHSSPVLDNLAVFLTNTSGPFIMTLLTVVGTALLLLWQRQRLALYFLFTLGGAVGFNALLKLLFARERPDLWTTIVTESSYSFPSGHAMVSSALALSIIALVWSTRWRWLAIILGGAYIVAIGLTRLYLGVHYPSDVIGGWCVSFAWVLTVKIVLDHFHLLRRPVKALKRAEG